MANVKNENVKVKAKIFDNDVTIKSKIGTNDVKIKSGISGIPSATTERKGIVRLATVEEAIEGIDNNIVITPYTLNKVTHFIHEQGVASNVWIIEHNLNKKPSVTVVDTADEIQVPDTIIYNNKDTITISFLSEFAGKAYLN